MPKNLKILVISNLYPPQVVGGYERSIADFATILACRGHDVTVLTGNIKDLETNCDLGTEGVKLNRTLLLKGKWSQEKVLESFPVESHAYINCTNSYTLIKTIHELQPDICLVGNIDLLGLEILQTVMATGVPVVHYVMNAIPGFPANLSPPAHLYRCITCSDWVRQTMKEQGYRFDDSTVLYPGAVVDEFYQETLPPHDYLRIAYASLVMPYKGADVLIEALSLLSVAGVKFEATIAGGTLMPDFVQTLKSFVQSEGLENQIKFPGTLSRQELKKLYSTHNVLVFPSRFQEPFGISQIEAMAAGLTLVTSGTGGAKEIVKHGQDGLIFETEDPLNLADTLAALARDLDQWKSITLEGQKKALSEFSQEVASKTLENIFLDMTST
ncbi:MAG: glycosyltransferase family 4 protein [Thermosynechococcaceae cyanobacterium]